MTEAAAPNSAPAAAPQQAAPGAAPSAAPTAAQEESPKPLKIKVRKPHQRACDERDAKGQCCCGHLKRWYDYSAEVEAAVGKNAEVYRCENCKTIYRPHPKEMPRSYTQRY